jgi:NAD(P)-dependent dehydrogenase (short-subunit alcohol dehydrogenase family)
MTRTIVVFCTILLMAAGTASTCAQEEATQKAVLITGASSGIGRLTAERLADAGYLVYAGARSQDDIDELNKIDNIVAVRLDVTVQEDIDAAVDFVREQGRGLWGIVNNAGINVIDPLIELDEGTMDLMFDVNVYGVVRITRAFAPMVIESKGRIVNVSSISGVLAGGLTGYGVYSMTKHAIEAYTDQLAWEMMKFGVAVSAIEPGNYASSIGVTRCRRMLGQRDSRNYRYFADEMNEYYESCEARLASDEPSSSPEPVPVAAAIEHALFDPEPKEHYLVVSDPVEAQITIGKLVEELVHMNGDHEYSYDRETLIRFLDGEEAVRKGELPRRMPGEY